MDIPAATSAPCDAAITVLPSTAVPDANSGHKGGNLVAQNENTGASKNTDEPDDVGANAGGFDAVGKILDDDGGNDDGEDDDGEDDDGVEKEVQRQVLEAVFARRATCRLALGDARAALAGLAPTGSAHLVITSPPYWNIKPYNAGVDGQLGRVDNYDTFLAALADIWRACFAALVPGGRMVVVVGDPLLSRKRHGRHHMVPLHADIVVACRAIGFDCLAPIVWHKIGSVAHESGGAGMLGKPYEPNAIIKNDIEYVLMLRKPGGYRSPTAEQRVASRLSKPDFRRFFRQVWSDVPGTRSRHHPAPFPQELAARLVRMFSFAGDTVIDPFAGSGTTLVAALQHGRNAMGVEIDPAYHAAAMSRLCALDRDPIWSVCDTNCAEVFYRMLLVRAPAADSITARGADEPLMTEATRLSRTRPAANKPSRGRSTLVGPPRKRSKPGKTRTTGRDGVPPSKRARTCGLTKLSDVNKDTHTEAAHLT